MYLASAIRAAGFSGALRRRMTAERLAGQPFRQLGRAVERVRDCADAGDTAALLREAHYLRALLDACQQAAASVTDHLEDYGVSVDLVFQVDQLTRRAHRLDELLTCVLSPQPARETAQLLAGLVRVAHESRSVRSLFASHYSLLARKVAERSAERGEHYITRDRSEWRAMLGAAAGGGAVLRPAPRCSSSSIARPRPVGVLGRPGGGRQLRGELRADPAAALHRRHQAAGDDRAGDGRTSWSACRPAWRRRCREHRLDASHRDRRRRRAARLRRRGGAPDPHPARRHPRQPGAGGADGDRGAAGLAGGLRRAAGRPRGRAAHRREADAARADGALRRLHRRAAVRQQPDRRLGRELVRLAPARQRAGLEPAHRRPPRRGARAALGAPGGGATSRRWRRTSRSG